MLRRQFERVGVVGFLRRLPQHLAPLTLADLCARHDILSMSTMAAAVHDVIACLAHDGTNDDADTRNHYHATLVARIRTGDSAAFETLVVDVAGPLEAYAYRCCGSGDTAQDIVQDVLARLWEQRATLRIHGSVQGYLYAAVRNRAHDLRRQAHAEMLRYHIVRDDEHPIGMGAAPLAPGATDEEIERREIIARVAHAINTLPPRAREAAILRWVDGLSRAEVANVMGVALGTVKNHLTLASTTIRTLFLDICRPD